MDVGYKAHDLVLEYRASIEIEEIARCLRLDLIGSKKPPRDFQHYLQTNMKSRGRDPGMDPWGNPYYLIGDLGNELMVASCGADSECDTEDDLEVFIGDREGSFQGRGDGHNKFKQGIRKFFGN
ncbi:MAG: hypothetical protein GY847_32400 [Proteobacteria bacterium]|nr:hypothetical protein [Pseudomonadota bacterium]